MGVSKQASHGNLHQMSASPSLVQPESGWYRVDTKSGCSLAAGRSGGKLGFGEVAGVKEVREIKSQFQAAVLLRVPFPRTAMTLDLDISWWSLQVTTKSESWGKHPPSQKDRTSDPTVTHAQALLWGRGSQLWVLTWQLYTIVHTKLSARTQQTAATERTAAVTF